MKVETRNELNKVDSIMQLVGSANQKLKEGQLSIFHITVEIKLETHPTDETNIENVFTLWEGDYALIAYGSDWESFIDDIKTGLGSRFPIITEELRNEVHALENLNLTNNK